MPSPQPLPFRVIAIGALLGDSDAVTSLAMTTVFGSGSRNFWIDQFARATQVLGYLRQNATGVELGGNPAALIALHPFLLADGPDVAHQVLGVFDDATAHWSLQVTTDNGVTWTELEDFGVDSLGALPDFAALGTALAITNGVIPPQVCDGATTRDGGSTRLAAPTITDVEVGTLNGNYQWRITPIRSDGSRKVGSEPSAVTPASLRQFDVEWVADADTDVVGYEVNRTLGTDAVFYFVAYVDGRTTVTYRDNTIDSDLRGSRQMQEFGDPPPDGAYFCFSHKARMWYLRTDALPRTAFYSDVGLIDSVYTDANKFDATDAQSAGDVLTGGTGEFREMAVLWLEKSVWVITGTGQIQGAITDFNLRKTDVRVGSVHTRAIAKVPLGARYQDERGQLQETSSETLAYFTPVGDIRLFDGFSAKSISEPKAALLLTRNYAARRSTWCVHDDVRQEIAWTFAAGASEIPDTTVVWNYKYGVWYERDWPFAHAVAVTADDNSNLLLAGEGDTAVGGLCYRLWTGMTRDGDPIEAALLLKGLYGTDDAGNPALMQDKRWREVHALILGAVDELTAEWVPGEASNSATAVGSDVTAVVSGQVVRLKLQDEDGIYFESRGVRLRLLTSGEDTWSVDGLLLAYQLLPGLRRPFTT